MGRVVWLQITIEKKKRWMEKRNKGDWKWLLHQEREGWRNNRGNEVCFLGFFPFIFISWRLITLQYCSGFCHTLTWINHGFTCVPHPELPSRKWGFWRKIDLSVCVFKVERLVRACMISHFSCVWLCNLMNCSPPGSSVHGIFQAKILKWVAVPSTGDLPQPGIQPTSPAPQAHSLPLRHQGSPGWSI